MDSLEGSEPQHKAPQPHGASRAISVLRRCGAGVLVLCLCAVQLDGLWPQVLAITLLTFPIVMVVVRVVPVARRRVEWRLWTNPTLPELRHHRAQWLIRGAFWLTAAASVWMLIPESGAARGEVAAARWIYLCLGLFLALAEGIQPRVVHRSGNVVFALALALLVPELLKVGRVPPGPFVELQPPFRGRWIVVQGGTSSLINHHYGIDAQRYALDLVVDEGKEASPPERLESYAAWGRTLYAPVAGTVVKAADAHPDQPIGGSDPENAVGNQVVIEMAPQRYVLLAHIKQGSILVKDGQQVRAGQPIAQCGNSGNTSEPHLHLQVQSHADFRQPDLRTYPIGWKAHLTRGQKQLPSGSFLRRNDRITASTDD
jgi:biotin carboxyl carrier protein